MHDDVAQLSISTGSTGSDALPSSDSLAITATEPAAPQPDSQPGDVKGER